MAKRIPLGERGTPLGDHNARTVIPDAIVEELRDLHEQDGLGWRKIARLFPAYRARTIKAIIYYERRNVTPVRWKSTP